MTRQIVKHELDRLRGRYAEVMEFMVPRSRLSDGSLGYILSARTEMDIRVGVNPDSEQAIAEKLVFDIERCEVIVPDPTFTKDGAMRFDIEILAIEGKTTAKRLFGQPVEVTMRVGRGTSPFMRPTYGRTEVGLEDDLSAGVISTQWVNLEVDTPYGTLRNREPAEMRATITQLPPLLSPYVQQGTVDLFNSAGVWMANKAASLSVPLEIEVPEPVKQPA